MATHAEINPAGLRNVRRGMQRSLFMMIKPPVVFGRLTKSVVSVVRGNAHSYSASGRKSQDGYNAVALSRVGVVAPRPLGILIAWGGVVKGPRGLRADGVGPPPSDCTCRGRMRAVLQHCLPTLSLLFHACSQDALD